MSGKRGWFADVPARGDEEQPPNSEHQWQPCLETGTGYIPCFDMWFQTKAACEDWIRENASGVGMLEDE
jgi:hypothetical protein